MKTVTLTAKDLFEASYALQTSAKHDTETAEMMRSYYGDRGEPNPFAQDAARKKEISDRFERAYAMLALNPDKDTIRITG